MTTQIPAALAQWFDQCQLDVMSRLRWVRVLLYISLVITLASLAAASFPGTFEQTSPLPSNSATGVSSLYRQLTALYWIAYLPLVFTAVTMTSVLSFTQLPPAEAHLAEKQEILAGAYYARVGANCWRFIGGSVLVVAALYWIFALVITVKAVVYYGSLANASFQAPHIWSSLCYAVIDTAWMLVFLFWQRYTLLTNVHSKLRYWHCATPALVCHGLNMVSYSAIWLVPQSLAENAFSINEMFYVAGLLCLFALLACWALNRQAYAAAQRLFAEES